MKYVFMIITLITLFFLFRSIINFFFAVGDYNIHKKRLKQLQFKDKNEDGDINELIDKITKPIISSILPKVNIKNIDNINNNLKMAKWKINSQQYIALQIMSKALGIFTVLILFGISKFMAILWGGILFLGLGTMLKNSANNRRNKIMMEFPDFIRITQGYLTANLPFANAVTETIRFMGTEWQEILQKFVVEVELKSLDEALDGLKDEIDMFEVNEFISLVKLVLEQGGDAKAGFNNQAEKIKDMLLDTIEIKINKRKMMGTFIQMPLLLCNLAVFGLPTIGNFMNFAGM